MRISGLIAAALVAAMAGCAFVDEILAPPGSAAAGGPPAPKRKPSVIPPPHPKIKPHLESQSETGSGMAALRVEPAVLVGMSRDQAVALLGQPIAVRERPPSRVWSYGSDGCALELFFFMDLDSSGFRVLAYELKAGQASDQAKRACFGRLRADRHAGS